MRLFACVTLVARTQSTSCVRNPLWNSGVRHAAGPDDVIQPSISEKKQNRRHSDSQSSNACPALYPSHLGMRMKPMGISQLFAHLTSL